MYDKDIACRTRVFLRLVNNCVLSIYRIVASRSMSQLVTCLGLYRLLMKGIFGPYVL